MHEKFAHMTYQNVISNASVNLPTNTIFAIDSHRSIVCQVAFERNEWDLFTQRPMQLTVLTICSKKYITYEI